MDLDEVWDRLRQGARNVAGVSWQVAVTAHLVTASRAGALPFVEFTPEGFEDVDCRDSDGRSTFVQMKEVGGGAGRLTATDIAEVLDHAASAAAAGETLVLVTDGDLGSALQFTGWDGFVADQGGNPVNDVLTHLIGRGRTRTDAEALVARARVVSLPWNPRSWTEVVAAEALDIHPAVASFAISRLYDKLTALAASQRGTTRLTASKLTVGDLDAIVADTQSVIDVSGLDAAVSAGVCAPADYVHDSGLTLRQFYAGVDGAPAHIAGHLDVLRPREMAEIVDAAANERYAILLGPSGSGKSVLLWRASRDAVLGARVVRVRQVASQADVELLVRHVRLLNPSAAAPVVVAADNLGRPVTRRWPDAVERLREQPSVMLIGAVRSEDFHPGIVRGGARIVEPHMDSGTAQYIAEEIDRADVPVRMDPREAEDRADGLLMEFIALLTTGHRLKQVLADQMAALREPGRELQRALARLVTAAHAAGVPVPAAALPDAVGMNGSPEAVGDALSVLRGEHVLVSHGTEWRGLHELRSQTITTLLHESPPPTLAQTYADVIGLLPPVSAAWTLRRAAEALGGEIHDVARVLARNLAYGELSAADAAVLLEGAERADNMLYAKTCVPILQQHLRPGLTLHHLAMLAYGARNQGLADDAVGDTPWDEAMRRARRVGDELPERATAVASLMAAGLSADRIVELTDQSPLTDAVRLLEATSGLIQLPQAAATHIFHRFDVPTDVTEADMYARLISILAKLAQLQDEQIAEVFGIVETRAASVISPDRHALRVEVDPTGVIITTLMQPPNRSSDAVVVPSWETTQKSKANEIEARGLHTAKRLADACPEAPTIEVITLTASGRRLLTAGFEPGYRRIARSAFRQLDRTSTRRSVGFQAAVRRLTAAGTWTKLIADQVTISVDLVDLLKQAPLRLTPTDNAHRRRQWHQRVQQVQHRASELASTPISMAHDLNLSNAQADDAERQVDPTSDVLASLAETLLRLVDEPRHIAIASNLRDIAERIATARSTTNPRLVGIGQPLPEELTQHLTMMIQILLAAGRNPGLLRRIRASNLTQTCRDVIHEVADTDRSTEKASLETSLHDVDGLQVHEVEDPDPFVTSLTRRAWLITAPLSTWQHAVQALHALPDEQRASFTSHVLVVAVENHIVLPFAIRLTHSGTPASLPVTPDVLCEYTEQIGLQTPANNTVSTANEVVHALVELSSHHALMRQREPTWPSPPSPPIPTLQHIQQRVTDQPLNGAHTGELVAALNALVHQVRLEETGDTTVTLAGELFDAMGREPSTPSEAPELLEAVAVVSATSSLSTGEVGHHSS